MIIHPVVFWGAHWITEQDNCRVCIKVWCVSALKQVGHRDSFPEEAQAWYLHTHTVLRFQMCAYIQLSYSLF